MTGVLFAVGSVVWVGGVAWTLAAKDPLSDEKAIYRLLVRWAGLMIMAAAALL